MRLKSIISHNQGHNNSVQSSPHSSIHQSTNSVFDCRGLFCNLATVYSFTFNKRQTFFLYINFNVKFLVLVKKILTNNN
jgi:hypothetical protein